MKSINKKNFGWAAKAPFTTFWGEVSLQVYKSSVKGNSGEVRHCCKGNNLTGLANHSWITRVGCNDSRYKLFASVNNVRHS